MKKIIKKLLIVVILVVSFLANLAFNNQKVYAQEKLPRISDVVFAQVPLYEGETQTLNVYSTGNGNVQYRVWLYSIENNEWKDITNGYTSPLSAQTVYKVSIPNLDIGQYKVSVWVKRADKNPVNKSGYDNYFAAKMDCLEYDGQVYDKRKDQTKSKEKKDTIPTIEKVICEYSELYEENNQILDIVSRGFENVQYRVWICNKNTNKWFEATQGYTKPCYAQSACRIIIPKLTEGEYTVSLWIKRDGKAPINKKGYDEYAVFNINCLKSEETTINKELNGVKDNYKVGEAIQLKGSSDTKEEYRYSVYDVLNNEIKVNFKEYNGELSWKADKAGIYLLRIHRKNLESEYKINKLVVVGQPYKKSTGKVAYLTFDDGPSRKVTTRVLKVLDDYNVKATFFVVGEFAERNKDLIREEYRKGHTIGNHTYSHQYKKIYSSPTAFVNEINKTDRILKSIIPEYNTKLIRFPGGSMGKSKAYKAAVINAGYHDMDWNASTGDTTAYLVPVDKLMRNLKNSCKNKKSVIILMHDAPVKTTTADALPQVIEYLKSQGYEFKTLK